MIEIIFQRNLPGLNRMLNMHWGDKTKIKKQCLVEVMSQTRKQLKGPVSIKAIRYTLKYLDPFDNLPSSLKFAIDALVKAKVIEDDDTSILADRSIEQILIKTRKEQRTVLTIKPFKNNGTRSNKRRTSQRTLQHIRVESNL